MALMLHNAALLWYHAKRMANNDQAPHWDNLQQAMLDYWNDPAPIDGLCLCLDRITYRGSISDYVRLFQGVEIQILADAMPLDVRKHEFLRNLPAELVMELDQQSQSDMESVYLAARRWESCRRAARAVAHFHLGGSKNRRPRRDAPAPSIYQNYHDADAAHTTAPSEPTTVRRDSRPPAVANAPRDYNCTQPEFGYLAREYRKASRCTIQGSKRPPGHTSSTHHGFQKTQLYRFEEAGECV
ncbi:hypothetical protein EDB92DRAFT_667782 [Lactarius akahatsu]|uniref:Uncharacterized protein n=1 Tax=Lactarius akahatsu TaxID=416441 RepID=A0AAD4LHY2_9AGAM|nr:hypothetical protein EDB92DRAFT_667782 [Lactarius akahatsu]